MTTQREPDSQDAPSAPNDALKKGRRFFAKYSGISLWARLTPDLRHGRSPETGIRAGMVPRTSRERATELLWTRASLLGFETDFDAESAQTIRARTLLAFDCELNQSFVEELDPNLDDYDGVDWSREADLSSLEALRPFATLVLAGDPDSVWQVKLALGRWQGYECFYCGDDVKPMYQVDHFIPWSFYEGNDVWNLVAACPKCNRSKSLRLPPQKFLAALNERNARIIDEAAPEAGLDEVRERELAGLLAELYTSALTEGVRTWAGP